MRARLLKGLCLLSICIIGAKGQEPTRGDVTFRFEGNKVFSERELTGTAEKCLNNHPQVNERDYSDLIDCCLDRLKFFLKAKGHLQATVQRSGEQETKNGRRVLVRVDERALYRLGGIDIRGTTIISPAQIRGMLALKSGDVADGEAIGEWLFERVRKAYGDLGYLRFVAEPQPTFHLEIGAQTGTVDFTVEVEEGNLFTFGGLRFEGNGTVSPSQLRREMLVRTGESFNQELFEESLKIINMNHGYEMIDADRDVDYKLDDPRARVDLTIRLKTKSTRSTSQ
jgi:outer membrane protein assembly factor BamA